MGVYVFNTGFHRHDEVTAVKTEGFKTGDQSLLHV